MPGIRQNPRYANTVNLVQTKSRFKPLARAFSHTHTDVIRRRHNYPNLRIDISADGCIRGKNLLTPKSRISATEEAASERVSIIL